MRILLPNLRLILGHYDFSAADKYLIIYKVMMRIRLLSFLLSMVILSLAEETEKLRIDVKKRIPNEECLKESKIGDTLEVHYTVSFIFNVRNGDHVVIPNPRSLVMQKLRYFEASLFRSIHPSWIFVIAPAALALEI